MSSVLHHGASCLLGSGDTLRVRFPPLQWQVLVQGGSRARVQAALAQYLAVVDPVSSAHAADPDRTGSRVELRYEQAPGIFQECESWPEGTVRLLQGGGPAVRFREAVVEFGSGAVTTVRLPRTGTGSTTAIAALDIAISRALAVQGVSTLHAAAFKVDGGSIVAAGPSMSGKSSLAAASLLSGGKIISDDALLMGLDITGTPVVRAYRRDVFLRTANGGVELSEVTDLGSHRLVGDERRLCVERSSHDGLFEMATEPTVLWFPLIARDQSRSRISKLDAAGTLVRILSCASPAFLTDLFPIEQESLKALYTRVANSLNSFEITLGRDLIENPGGCLASLVDETC